MDRRRSMIVWLLIFGLIGVLSERIGASLAPGQAMKNSVSMKKDVGSKRLKNIGTETRKCNFQEAQLRRKNQRMRDRDREEKRRERERALERGHREYQKRVLERQKQWAAGGRP